MLNDRPKWIDVSICFLIVFSPNCDGKIYARLQLNRIFMIPLILHGISCSSVMFWIKTQICSNVHCNGFSSILNLARKKALDLSLIRSGTWNRAKFPPTCGIKDQSSPLMAIYSALAIITDDDPRSRFDDIIDREKKCNNTLTHCLTRS